MLENKISFRIILGLLVAFIVSLITVIGIAQCLIGNQYRSIVCDKPIAADGMRHVTVSINGGTASEQGLIQDAIGAWNEHSDITGVVFDVAPPGAAGDLQINYTTDTSATTGTNGCARMDTNAPVDTLWWGEDLRLRRVAWQDWAEGDRQFASVIMHELGHFLGLAHTSTPDIMQPGFNCYSPAGATTVTVADAQKVANCRGAFCARFRTGTGGGSGTNCQPRYEIVDYDVCDAEGCRSYHTYEYVGEYCE